MLQSHIEDILEDLSEYTQSHVSGGTVKPLIIQAQIFKAQEIVFLWCPTVMKMSVCKRRLIHRLLTSFVFSGRIQSQFNTYLEIWFLETQEVSLQPILIITYLQHSPVYLTSASV